MQGKWRAFRTLHKLKQEIIKVDLDDLLASTDRSTFVARLTNEEISKAVLPDTLIFSSATKKDFLQRIQSSPP